MGGYFRINISIGYRTNISETYIYIYIHIPSIKWFVCVIAAALRVVLETLEFEAFIY